jgi:hypothetical protein
MKNHFCKCRWLAGTAGLLILSGCVSLSSLQSPRVLEPKQEFHGFALAGFYDRDQNGLGLYEVDIYGRFGIAKNWDLGYKIYGVPLLFGGIQGDIKYQILAKPLKIAGDLGLSYSRVAGDEDVNVNAFVVQPMILVGDERFYAGAKAVCVATSGRVEIFDSNSFGSRNALPGIVLGAVIEIGKKRQLAPEMNIYFLSKGETMILPAIGLQIRK